jgi:hypothetical protein
MPEKKFIVYDRERDPVGCSEGYDSKAEAVEAARLALSNGNRYFPFTVFEAVATVSPAPQPATVVDL